MTEMRTVTSPGMMGGSTSLRRLLLVYAPDGIPVPRSHVLNDLPAVFGRVNASFVLDDVEASRRHFEIAASSAGVLVLRDLDSRNGTFVNGARSSVFSPLQHGDIVRAGSHVFVFQELDETDCRRLLDPRRPASLVGDSPAVARIREDVRNAARGLLPVSITGPTGVGKELVAQAIHEESGRTGPFVALNCGALPETLAESELFGHVVGAFTGAQARQGLFAKARGGTLFLDEIGEMDLSLQKKLLRVLSTGEVRKVGSDDSQRTDVRIVSATNADLDLAVQSSAFRGDLFARLAGHRVSVPSLGVRREDILLLFHHFLQRDSIAVALSANAAEALLNHAWSFNVRELEQLTGVLSPRLKETGILIVDDLPDQIRSRLVDRPGGEARKGNWPIVGIRRDSVPTKAELEALLAAYGGSVVKAAAFFEKDRRQVHRWIKQLGIDRGRPSAASDDEDDA